MVEIIKELNIEVSKPNVFQAVVAKQYDMNSRFIKATFVDEGKKITINKSPTLKVIINAQRPDGEAKGFDGVINDDGTVTVPLHSWMLDQVGTVNCDISVIDTATEDNKKLTTTAFTLFVEKAAWGGEGITSDPQYDVLIQLLDTVESAGEMAEEALQKSTEANAKYDACVQATKAAEAVVEDNEILLGVMNGRLDEAIAMRTTGGGTAYQYEDDFCKVLINTNGVIADATVVFTDIVVEKGGSFTRSIPAAYSPFEQEVALTHSFGDDIYVCIIAGQSGEDALLYASANSGESFTLDGAASVAEYHLNSIHIPELVDIRVGADGTVHGSAGDAARNAMPTAAAREMELITSSMERRFIGNLINPATVVSGIILSNGTVQSDDRFRTTDFIAVTAGETLNFKAYTDNADVDSFRFLAAYDENKNAVQSAAGTYVATYVVPDGISYIRGTIAVAEVNGAVLVSGELPAEYVPYVGETYLATEQFLEHIVYTKPQVDAKIAEECEKQSVSIKTEINNDVDTKIAEATAELDEELSFAIDTLNNPDVPIPITFEQGGIDATTGQNTDVEKKYLVRTAGDISAKCGDEIKISIVEGKHTYRVYKYSADGEFVERTAALYLSKTIEATEDCFYRIQCQASSGAVAPDFADDLIVTITTAIYKRNVSVKFDEAYVKETDKVIDTALDETADIRLLCVGDPHNFDDYKYQKYDEIMGRGVVDYLVGLGDYVDYEDHGAKSNYRKLLLNAINKAGRERNRIYVTGNHDVSMRAGGVGASDIDLVMHPKDCFDVFYRHLKPCMVVDPEKPYGGYFYIDDAHSKIRLIVLNSNEIVNDDGTVTWYYEQSKISQRQLDWFANSALKVDEDGWSVVVFLHNDTPYGFSGGNARALFDILSAAKNGTSVNRTFTAYCRMVTDANGNATSTVDTENGDTYTLNADFTNGHTVDVIGVVHGHTHEKDWREYSGIKSISVRNDNGKHNDRYISKGTFARNTVYYFTTIHGNIYTFTAPDDETTDNAVQFEYCAYHTQFGNNTAGYFVQADGNQYSVAITGVSSAPSGATEITGFVRERDGSLAGEESCEILCINKDARTITTVPYGTGTRRVISY